MSIKTLTIGDPFFQIRVLKEAVSYEISDKTIVLNLSGNPIKVREQSIGELQSVILKDITAESVTHAVWSQIGHTGLAGSGSCENHL